MPEQTDPALTPNQPFTPPGVSMTKASAEPEDSPKYKESVEKLTAALMGKSVDQLREELAKAQEELNQQRVRAYQGDCRERAVSGAKLMRSQLDCVLQDLISVGWHKDVMDACEHRHAEAYLAMMEAQVNLKQTIMWLGMVLKAIGPGNRYPGSYDPSNKEVHPPADGLKM